MSKRQMVPLGEAVNIIDGDRGKQYPKQAEFFESGYCIFLNTKNLPNTIFDFSNTQFITKLKDGSLRKGRLERGDIVLTTRGTLGNLAYYNDRVPYNNIRINSGMVILRNSNLNINTNYLFMVLKSPLFKEFVTSTRSGSAQPQLPIRDLQTFKLPLPPLAEQERIAAILSAFDDKIESNRNICADLEAAAKLIFRRDFIANPEAEGWEEVKLGDVAEISTGKRPSIKSNIQSEEFPVPITGASGVMGYTSSYLYNTEVITIGRVGTHGVVLRYDEEVWISDNALIFTGTYMNFIFFFLHTIDYKAYNRGSTQPLITQGDMKNISIPLPPQALLEKFEKTVAPMYAQIKNLQQENRSLVQARDLLLPKLMRGEA